MLFFNVVLFIILKRQSCLHIYIYIYIYIYRERERERESERYNYIDKYIER